MGAVESIVARYGSVSRLSRSHDATHDVWNEVETSNQIISSGVCAAGSEIWRNRSRAAAFGIHNPRLSEKFANGESW